MQMTAGCYALCDTPLICKCVCEVQVINAPEELLSDAEYFCLQCRATSHRMYDSGWDDLQARQSCEIGTLQTYQEWCPK